MHFLRTEVQVILNRSSRLKKHQTPEFLVMNDILYFFLKKSSFSTFSDIFENNQLHYTKIIVCVLFYENVLDQAQYSLISRSF